jgi:uncharacterized protein (TIGR03643 family)
LAIWIRMLIPKLSLSNMSNDLDYFRGNFCEYSGMPSPDFYMSIDKDIKKEVGYSFSQIELDRIIEMAWEDRTPFEAIAFQFRLKEKEVIELMRIHMKPSSFRMWRKRTNGRSTKHLLRRTNVEGRFKCTRQRSISSNKISKRKF